MEDIDWSKYLFDSTEPGAPEVKDLSENFLANTTMEQNNCIHNTHDIFFTINPSDYYWNVKYGKPVTEEVFRSQLIDEINKMLNYYKKHRHICMDAHIHFEKSAEGRVHSHGVILGLPEAYYPYEGELYNMSKRLHKVFGKPRLRSDISAHFKWSHANDHTYMCKQNYLKPCRILYSNG